MEWLLISGIGMIIIFFIFIYIAYRGFIQK